MVRLLVRRGSAALVVGCAWLIQPSPASAWWQYGGPLYQRSFPDMPPPSYFGYNLDEQHPSYFGGARYREYYNFGRGALMADFPPPLPNYYGRVRGFHMAPPPSPAAASPAAVLLDPRAAHLDVHVPADAEVWLEGLKTHQTGEERHFTSPALIADQDYVYEVRAKWTEDGRPVEQSRSVSVRAGQRVRIDFLSSEPEGLPVPKAVKPELPKKSGR